MHCLHLAGQVYQAYPLVAHANQQLSLRHRPSLVLGLLSQVMLRDKRTRESKMAARRQHT